ncbi:MAG TPA: Bcr/CflA family drug resistance efflux transporter, partial [Hyphomonadaceae bacterium]|nr:Bcr/CflA family drug resistance efflux transporter [Hyphomonadaceae bacterium]
AGQYNGSIIPVLMGFVILGVVSLIIVFVTERFTLFGRGQDEAAE